MTTINLYAKDVVSETHCFESEMYCKFSTKKTWLFDKRYYTRLKSFSPLRKNQSTSWQDVFPHLRCFSWNKNVLGEHGDALKYSIYVAKSRLAIRLDYSNSKSFCVLNAIKCNAMQWGEWDLQNYMHISIYLGAGWTMVSPVRMRARLTAVKCHQAPVWQWTIFVCFA